MSGNHLIITNTLSLFRWWKSHFHSTRSCDCVNWYASKGEKFPDHRREWIFMIRLSWLHNTQMRNDVAEKETDLMRRWRPTCVIWMFSTWLTFSPLSLSDLWRSRGGDENALRYAMTQKTLARATVLCAHTSLPFWSFKSLPSSFRVPFWERVPTRGMWTLSRLHRESSLITSLQHFWHLIKLIFVSSSRRWSQEGGSNEKGASRGSKISTDKNLLIERLHTGPDATETINNFFCFASPIRHNLYVYDDHLQDNLWVINFLPVRPLFKLLALLSAVFV